MSEFKDKIPAAGGKVEFLCDDATGGITSHVSCVSFTALYQAGGRPSISKDASGWPTLSALSAERVGLFFASWVPHPL